MRLDAISREDVDAFLVHQSQAMKEVKVEVEGTAETVRLPRYSTTTVNYGLDILKAVLRDAADRRAIRQNPALRVKSIGRPADADDDKAEMRILEPAEITRLLNAAEEPWRTLYLLAVNSGLRRGELLALRLVDVDTRKGLVHVSRQLQSGQGWRSLRGQGHTAEESLLPADGGCRRRCYCCPRGALHGPRSARFHLPVTHRALDGSRQRGQSL